MSGLKKCITCQQDKPLEDYPTGRNECKKCRNDYVRAENTPGFIRTGGRHGRKSYYAPVMNQELLDKFIGVNPNARRRS